jgi:hypothetical protein
MSRSEDKSLVGVSIKYDRINRTEGTDAAAVKNKQLARKGFGFV